MSFFILSKSRVITIQHVYLFEERKENWPILLSDQTNSTDFLRSPFDCTRLKVQIAYFMCMHYFVYTRMKMAATK